MPKVLIVGAGIGGLTTAIALRRAGIDATVFEQAPELREVGAGISLWPNAIKALRRLGIGDAVETVGRAVAAAETRDQRGALLHSSPVDQLAGHGSAPLWSWFTAPRCTRRWSPHSTKTRSGSTATASR